MIAITFRTGPRQCNTHELKTVEMIEAAWNGKRELCVSLREIENLHMGKVGIFMELDGSSTVMECLQSYPKCQRLQVNRNILKYSASDFLSNSVALIRPAARLT